MKLFDLNLKPQTVNKNKLFIFLALLLLALVVAILITDKTVINELFPTEDKYVQESEIAKPLSNIDATRLSALSDPMGFAFGYIMPNSEVFRNNQLGAKGAEKPFLADGEILIETFFVNEGKRFRLLDSKNPNYPYKPGDYVSFRPSITAKNLIVQKEDDGLYWSNELPGYQLPDSLKDGDKVVFICESSNCLDGRLSWALVYFKYYDK